MNWFSKKRNIAITVGAAILAVVVIGLIVYGVTTHSEPGLLKVCWQADGTASYVTSAELEHRGTIKGNCDFPVEARWSRKQIPLKVGWDMDPLHESDDRAVKAAIKDINDQLGFPLLTERHESQDSDVEILLQEDVPEVNAPYGWVTHYMAGDNRLYCEVFVQSLGISERLVYLVTHHELLHCAGLAHDIDNPASAMFPLTRDDTLEERMGAARITDFDRALLRRLYHD